MSASIRPVPWLERSSFQWLDPLQAPRFTTSLAAPGDADAATPDKVRAATTAATAPMIRSFRMVDLLLPRIARSAMLSVRR